MGQHLSLSFLICKVEVMTKVPDSQGLGADEMRWCMEQAWHSAQDGI
jgi:hypothetical protein